MTELHVLRVFIGPDGRGGNPLGVFLDGRAIEPARRQEVARALGFSETVFVDGIEEDGATARVAIFTPGTELAFAGHPTVGTSWLLRETGRAVLRLRAPAGDVDVWSEAGLAWIRARAAWVHEMTIDRLASPAEVEALTGLPPGEDSYYAWAWIDEAGGVLRSRYFAGGLGIVEDEATGAAAVVMGDRLGRPLTIRQGVGSELLVRPGPDGTVAVGGRVGQVEVRQFD
jgi:predicted PhzF superfamily epimerase YddE/YHI9